MLALPDKTDREEWDFHRVPLVLTDDTVCLLNVIQGKSWNDLIYERIDHGGSIWKEHQKTAAAIVKAIAPWLSTSLIWALREELAAEIIRLNVETPTRNHPIDRLV